MNIEDQVVSLALAKRLKEIGVKQDSIFVYEYFTDNCYAPTFVPFAIAKPLPKGCKQYSAFTSTELLKLLPNRITTKENEPFNSFRLNIEKSFYAEQDEKNQTILYLEEVYIVNYNCDSTECHGVDAWLKRTLTKNIVSSKITDALANMLIYLYENGLIEYEPNS